MLFIMILIIPVLVVLLCFAALFPRISKQQCCGQFLDRDYAHRGLFSAADNIPENSLPAFARAVRYGFAIELDVQLTKDHQAVVFHDDSLLRMCGADAKIWQQTLAELRQLPLQGTRERIPLLEEVLAQIDGQVPLLIELKLPTRSTALCAVVQQLLQEYQGSYCIQSFSPLALKWYRKHQPEILRGQLSDHFNKQVKHPGLLLFMAENLLLNWCGRPDFISYNYHYAWKCWSLKLLKYFFHTPVFVWTIGSAAAYQHCKKQYDAVIFDNYLPQNSTKQEA